MDRRLRPYKEVIRMRVLTAITGLVLLAGCAGAQQAPFAFQDGIGMRPDGPRMELFADPSGAFPAAEPRNFFNARFTVDGFSRLDALFRHTVSPGTDRASGWRRAASEPAIRYTAPPQAGGGSFDLNGYLSRNPATGLLVAQGDTILVERYQYGRTPQQRLTSFSMAKTIVAMLFGLAVEDGHIRSLDDLAETYVPGLKGREYGRTPLRHLLTMSSGVQFREDYDGTDNSAILSRRALGGQVPGGAVVLDPFNNRTAEPGRRWYYASSETFVLAMVVRAATGRPLADYFAERIWQPLGAEAAATWLTDASGQELGYMGFNATLRDYARLGMMMANGGRAGDRQLVPAAWLAEMTKAHFSGTQTGRWFGYGYQTWIFPDNDGSFALLGVRGQAIYVDPARKLVLVHTAVRPDARDAGGAETTALWREIRATVPRTGG